MGNPFFVVLADGRFSGSQETGSHDNGFSPQGKGGCNAPPVHDPAARDHGNMQAPGGFVGQDHSSNAVHAGMAAAFIAHRGYGIHSAGLGADSVAGRGNLMDMDDAGIMDEGDQFVRLCAGCLDCRYLFHAADVDELPHMIPGIQVRQNAYVDTEGFVRELLHLPDGLMEGIRGLVIGGVDGAQASCVGDGRGKDGICDILHSALDDGVFNVKHLCYFCFHQIVLQESFLREILIKETFP